MLSYRYDVILCTLRLAAADSTGDTMLLITGGSGMVTQENWAATLYLLICRKILYEFHAFRFESLYLPPLPAGVGADRSDFDVHGVLNDEQVQYM